ncbi:uncharacterized protein LOC142471181 [Ascaphus truei]|uniref:uncharacterized protein LOC142471181 n=1 Tax=Ascaphus truei TaxID=8439 RepID=UPI003F5A7E8F
MSSSHGDPNMSMPVHTQPQGLRESVDTHQKPFPLVPPGHNGVASDGDLRVGDISINPKFNLDFVHFQVEEVIFMDTIFQTRDGRILYSTVQESECCGSPLNITLRNPYEMDVIKFHLTSHGKCWVSYSDVSFVSFNSKSHVRAKLKLPLIPLLVTLNVAVPRASCIFPSRTETKSPYLQLQSPPPSYNPIEIISVRGSHCVARIQRQEIGKSSIILFQFPADMEATMKAVLLGAYLYIDHNLTKSYREVSPPRERGDWFSGGGGGDGGGGDGGGGDGGGGGGGDGGGGDGGCGGF